MSDDVNPQKFGEESKFVFSKMTETQLELCRRLDEIFKKHGLEMMPSTMFEGAICASDRRLRHNPDWLSQSANSLREILYPFYSRERKGLSKKVLTEDSAIKNRDFTDEIGRIYNLLNGIAHHGNSDKSKLSKADIDGVDFDKLIADFEIVMREALKRQLDLYKEIDKFFSDGVEQAKKEIANAFIASNPDARDYFFSKAPIDWIEWLNSHGFFDVLNVEAEDKTRYAFRMPELGYLAGVVEAGGDEDKVVKIMNDVDCVKNFNPEVVERFLWIAQKFSAKSLVKIIPKIKRENWIELMKSFKPSGYTYQPIVKKLVEAKEYESLLLLADVLLVLNEDKKETYLDNYFALSDVGYTEIFDALVDMDLEYAEKGIEFILDILKRLVKEKQEGDKSSYAHDSGFYLFDVDLFDMAINKSRGGSDREDLKSLLAVLVELIERKFAKQCGEARQIYEKYFAKLPDTHWMWRIKLFAMQFCPEVFDSELKQELTRFLSTDYYIDFLSGTPEFYTVLRKVFSEWPEGARRDFVEKIFAYFEKRIEEETDEKAKQWTKEYGWRVLSAIAQTLTKDEEKACEEKFEKKPDANYEPQPSIGTMRGGTVRDRSPVEISAVRYPDILALINELKAQLSPNKLEEEYKNDDFLNPRNAEGVGNSLKEDMKLRISDYLLHATDFLDPSLNIHYTYSFLRGVEEQLRAGQKLSNTDWENLFKLFEKFLKANQKDYLENGADEDRWLAQWVWVEKIIADILKYFLTKDYGHLFADKRAFILKLLEELLESEDPKLEYETGENGDLFHIAINSTRGVAFQAFANFVYQDGEKLKDDALDLYKKIITKASLSVRFIVGHYLASFYYRDKEKVKEIFKEIFPKGEDRYQDFFAAWEGYLANALYKEVFEALAEFYDYALGLDPSLYPERRKVRDFDGSVATHLALAFAHFDEVQYTAEEKHPLLEKLWDGNDTEKQKEFISFLGRGIISNANASAEWFKKQNVKLEKLQAFWSLILGRTDLLSEIYAEFGFWVNHEKDIFDYNWLIDMMAKTLEKSKGRVEWDYGTMARLDKFAKVDPEKTLIILEKYLIDGIYGDREDRKWFYLDDAKIAVFKDLYKSKPTETKALINKLSEKGGRTFWPLKDIVE